MKTRPRHILPALLAASPCLLASAQVVFREAANELGIHHIHSSGSRYGPGVAAVDFDLDGDLDIYLIEDRIGNQLYRNDGGTLVEVAAEYGLNVRPAGETDPENQFSVDVGGMMPAFADLDNDGDRDLFLTVWQEPCRLFRQADGQFVEEMGAYSQLSGNSAGFALGDFNRDRKLDIYVSDWGELDHLLAASASGGYSDVSASSGLWDVPNPAQAGWAALWYYHDDDLAPELYVLNDFGNPNFCYWNLGGSFLSRANQWFSADENSGASMGFALGDYDRDGDEDLFVTNTPPNNDFYRRDGNSFTNVMYTTDPNARALKDGNISWHADWIDLENDGWLDLFVVNGYIPLCNAGIFGWPEICSPPSTRRQPNRLWRNQGGAFTEITDTAEIGNLDLGRAGARGDYDLDGDVDLIVTSNNGPTRFYWNETENVGNWLSLRFTGTTSNREAYGAQVWVTTGSLTQRRLYSSTGGYLSQPGDELYFGLADAESVDRLRVLWPSGREDLYEDLPINRRLHLIEDPSEAARAILADPPSVGVATWQDSPVLRIELPQVGAERVRIHRALPGQFDGVVAELASAGESTLWWSDRRLGGEAMPRYRVEVERDGAWSMSAPATAFEMPRALALHPAFPNPFNPQTTIRFDVPGPQPRRVRLEIYDVGGRRVVELLDGQRGPGEHREVWNGMGHDGDAVGSGVYFARLSVAGVGTRVDKLTLVR